MGWLLAGETMMPRDGDLGQLYILSLMTDSRCGTHPERITEVNYDERSVPFGSRRAKSSQSRGLWTGKAAVCLAMLASAGDRLFTEKNKSFQERRLRQTAGASLTVVLILRTTCDAEVATTD